VRRVESDDLAAVARVHCDAFPDAAITRLGLGAVRRYYAWQCEPVHDAVNLVAQQGGQLVGFCFAGVFRGAMTGFLKRNIVYLLCLVAGHPRNLVDRRFRTRVRSGVKLLYRHGIKRVRGSAPSRPAAAPERPRSFGILAIATDPRQAGRGIGRALMEAAEAEARRRGFARMHLSVDPGNQRAIRFYEGLGWTRVVGGPEWRGEMARCIANLGP